MDRIQELGHLERTVLEALWARGTGNVRDVAAWLDQPLAYNTVMTTLDRLFKKGFLTREKRDRAFFYSPKFSQTEWQQRQASHLLSGFLTGPSAAGQVMISYLIDAVGHHDAALLDAMEARIKQKREELDRRSQA